MKLFGLNKLFHRYVITLIAVVIAFSYAVIPQSANADKDVEMLDNFFTVSSGPAEGNKVVVFDGAIEKYNGYFYMMGTGSMGNVYRSKDMIHWESRYELISNDQSTLPPYAGKMYDRYGASDLLFHNGVMFYGFNGTNLIHGDPSTMHTTPDFEHSFWNRGYDRGIDPQFMVAHNGDLLYLRKVNPGEPDPNTGAPKPGRSGAWLWTVDSFFNERGNPGRSSAIELLHTQPGHWGNMNFVNFEGPEMYYHNGQYYLLYASNQMFPETGLYDTGVAQADHYDQFDNSTKYHDKFLARNGERLMLNYDVILPTAEHGGQNYQFIFDQPNKGWNTVTYDDSEWRTGEGGFGFPLRKRAKIMSIYNGGITKNDEIWGAPIGPETLWTRRTFQLDEVPETTVLRYRTEGYGNIYVNGQELLPIEGQQRAYKMVEVPQSLLQEGENVISVEISRAGGKKLGHYHMDLGLYDTNGQAIEPDIIGPSQPNVIKGPNGFETWVVYKAFWNSDNGQGKDRVFFWDNEMVVDGPTSKATPGNHFDAWQPTFNDRFDTVSSLSQYNESGHQGSVSVKNDALYFDTPNEIKEMLLKHYEIENYFLETNIRFDDNDFGSEGRAGVTVWHQDEDNHVRFYINRDDRTYVITNTLDGNTTTEEFNLPDTFRFLHEDERVKGYGEQYHTLKLYKNGSKLFAELDHYKLNDDQPVLELDQMSVPGQIGLVCYESKCSMDNVSLTIGWSEYGSDFNDWDASWTVSENGLTSPSSEKALTVKGDPMREHEFSVNMDTGSLPEAGQAGIILEYIDDQNYVAAYTNYDNNQIELRRVKNGKGELLDTSSTARDTIYGHSNYEGKGQKEYVYDLRGPAEVSQAKMLWYYGNYNYVNKFYRLPNASSPNFGFDQQSGVWDSVDFTYNWKGRGDYHIADFDTEVKTDQLRLNVPSEINRPFTFVLREEISAQNFYRTVRKDGQLYLWVNNELIFDVKDPFKNRDAQIGFFTNGIETTYNSFTGFDISNIPYDRKN